MKKLIACLSLVLAISFVAVGFSACKKNSVVGTWRAVYAQQYINGELVGEGDYDAIYKEDPNDAIIIVLNKNGKGTYTLTHYEDVTNITWKKTKNGCIMIMGGAEWKGELNKGKLVFTATFSSPNREQKDVWTFKKVK